MVKYSFVHGAAYTLVGLGALFLLLSVEQLESTQKALSDTWLLVTVSAVSSLKAARAACFSLTGAMPWPNTDSVGK